MKIEIKKILPAAKMPTKGTEGAACFDLYSAEDVDIWSYSPRVKVSTGLAIEIPEGYCGRVYSRSSAFLRGLDIGSLVIDCDYRGELFIMVGAFAGDLDTQRIEIKKGERIAQLKIEKLVPTEFEWAEELSQTKRGAGGYGSTGR